jgi:REP element-mobilizing transposase RayT
MAVWLIWSMPVRFKHEQQDNSFYFITFTCFKWLPLFEKADAYNAVYKWFDWLHINNVHVTGYVIMPNHIHSLIYFPSMIKPLNTIIGNGKRFIAYDIIERLEKKNDDHILDILHDSVKKREMKKGQIHKVFNESFDAKECNSDKFLYQKLDYIHHNPVRKRWNLVRDFTDYEHSSASFYEKGLIRYKNILHLQDALSGVLH